MNIVPATDDTASNHLTNLLLDTLLENPKVGMQKYEGSAGIGGEQNARWEALDVIAKVAGFQNGTAH